MNLEKISLDSAYRMHNEKKELFKAQEERLMGLAKDSEETYEEFTKLQKKYEKEIQAVQLKFQSSQSPIEKKLQTIDIKATQKRNAMSVVLSEIKMLEGVIEYLGGEIPVEEENTEEIEEMEDSLEEVEEVEELEEVVEKPKKKAAKEIVFKAK